mgnify:CR=1 FL=1
MYHTLPHRTPHPSACPQVETTADMSAVTAARVQQAFLPKFENEGQVCPRATQGQAGPGLEVEVK